MTVPSRRCDHVTVVTKNFLLLRIPAEAFRNKVCN